jgi:hypothetical protein
VVAGVTAGLLKDIHTLVCKRLLIVLPPLSPTVQSNDTEGTQDSLLFPLPFDAIDIHVPSEPKRQVQDPPDVHKIIQL